MPTLERKCRQCGSPLAKGARANVFLCESCRKENERKKNHENNRNWYLRNKERLSKERSRKNKKEELHDDENFVIIGGRRVPRPSKEEVRNNVDRLFKEAERRRMFFSPESFGIENRRMAYDIVDGPNGPECSNPIVRKRSNGIEDTAPRKISTRIVRGREMVIETRGREVAGTFGTHFENN